jgi:putative Holliday junction resolvase
MARVLAVDLGAQRIGVALSDPSRILATPLTTVQRSGDQTADRNAIVGLAREHQVDTIVVGMPISMSGKAGAAATAAAAEIDALQSAVGADVRVVGVDERLTTVSAQRMLVERGVRAKDRRGQVDKNAAAIILQTFLEGEG